MQKSLLGFVQAAPYRLDIEFKDADGKPYKKTTVVKNKKETDTEEVPVYANKDSIMGEVWHSVRASPPPSHQFPAVQHMLCRPSTRTSTQYTPMCEHTHCARTLTQTHVHTMLL